MSTAICIGWPAPSGCRHFGGGWHGCCDPHSPGYGRPHTCPCGETITTAELVEVDGQVKAAAGIGPLAIGAGR